MKKILNRILGLIIIIVLLYFLFLHTKEKNNLNRQISKSFISHLKDSNYSFQGVVINVDKIEREGGFICMKSIVSNVSMYKLEFMNRLVSQIDSSKHIKHIGAIIFTKNDSNEVTRVQNNDIIHYNVNNDGTYKVFRNDTLIYQVKATIGRSMFEEDLNNYICE